MIDSLRLCPFCKVIEKIRLNFGCAARAPAKNDDSPGGKDAATSARGNCLPILTLYGELNCYLGQLASDYTQETKGTRGDLGFSAGLLPASQVPSNTQPEIQRLAQAAAGGFAAQGSERAMHQGAMRPTNQGLSPRVLRNPAAPQQGAHAAAAAQQVQPLAEQGRYHHQAVQPGMTGAASSSLLNAQPQQHFPNGRGQVHPVQPSPFFGRGQVLGSGPVRQQTATMAPGSGAPLAPTAGGARGGRGGARRQGYTPHAGPALHNAVAREHAPAVDPMLATASRSDAAPSAAAARAAGPGAARGGSRGRARGRHA